MTNPAADVSSEARALLTNRDQWQALVFLAEHLNERGYGLQQGDVVITGAMSGMFPAQPGEYRVDYGEFGEITFTVE